MRHPSRLPAQFSSFDNVHGVVKIYLICDILMMDLSIRNIIKVVILVIKVR